ncbi:MAG TPA: hypothetical protein VLS49_01190 [Usitatibacter sp.]|nr:hypothetical protein [Usitatibacter sp.]
MRDGNEDPLCGSVEYINRPLEVGSATFPRRVPLPAAPPVVVEDVRDLRRRAVDAALARLRDDAERERLRLRAPRVEDDEHDPWGVW